MNGKFTDKQILLREYALKACDCYDRYETGGRGSYISYRHFEEICKKIAELSSIESSEVEKAISDLGRGFTYEVQFDRLRALGIDLGDKLLGL